MDTLNSIAKNLNLEILSILSLSSLKDALNKAAGRLDLWQKKGFAADMGYMNRDKSLFSDPTKLLPEIKSIITFAVPYSAPTISFPMQQDGFGKVARYAWGLDYHPVLKRTLEKFVIQARDLGVLKVNSYRIFSDSVPTLERAIAERAGIGFVGKSSMMISPGMGSYFFLAEILLDSELEDFNNNSKSKSNCGTCTNCITQCPTNAIVGERVVDAGKCISYLTIEKRGILSEREMFAIGDWIFGCDVCQEVCPYNHKGVHGRILEEFNKMNGSGPYLELSSILKIKSNDEFRQRFRNTPMMRTKRDGLVRNAMAVACNQKNFSVLNLIINILKTDESEMLRTQAKMVLKMMEPFSTGIDKNQILACEVT